MVYITRRMEFSASHRLYNPTWHPARNEEVYGKCNNPNGHGHNYVLEVTVRGPVDPETGMVMDLKVLKEILDREIIEKVDHKHLNYDVDFMRGIIPTAENMAGRFWEIISGLLPKSCQLCEVKVYESANNIAFYRGEGYQPTFHAMSEEDNQIPAGHR